MKSALLYLLAPLLALAAPAAELEDRQAATSIDALFKAKGKLYYGVATDQNRLSTGKSAAVIQQNFGQVTPENSMKWDATESSNGNFNFATADYLVNWWVSFYCLEEPRTMSPEKPLRLEFSLVDESIRVLGTLILVVIRLS